MKLLSTRIRYGALPLLGLAVLLAGHGLKGQTPSGTELLEMQGSERRAANRPDQDPGTLEAKVARDRDQSNSLSEHLASALGQAKQAREEYEELRLNLEGLGIAALNGSNAELQQRLLAALSDLRIEDKQKHQLIEALMNLSEVSLAMVKSTPNVNEENQQALNKSLSAAEKAIATAQNTHPENSDSDLQNAKVVSIKEGLGIMVLNVGSKQGVHPGMPITIYRQDKPIARAMVADVRASICGAVVQELVNERDTDQGG